MGICNLRTCETEAEGLYLGGIFSVPPPLIIYTHIHVNVMYTHGLMGKDIVLYKTGARICYFEYLCIL